MCAGGHGPTGTLKGKWPDGTEVAAGLILALSLSATLVLVPWLLFQAGMDFTAAYTACVLSSVVGTAWLACRGLPFIAAPSVSIAAWLVYLVIISRGFSWQQVLGLAACVSLAGTVIFASRWGGKLLEAVPQPVRWALMPALGLMLILLGLMQGRIIVASPWSVTMLGDFQDPLAYLGLSGILLGALLLALRVRGALAWSCLLTAALAFLEGFWIIPPAPVLLPEGLWKTAGQLTLMGAAVELKPAEYIGTGLALLLTVSSQSAAVLKGMLAGPERRVLRDLSSLSLGGALLGCLPLTVSPVSAAMPALGGRRGYVAALVAAVLAVLLFFEPVVKELATFPALTVPVLVLAGVQLLKEGLAGLPWGDLRAVPTEDFLPAACVLVLLPLSWNIAAGLGAGVVLWSLLLAAAGRGAEVPWLTRLLALFFIAYFLLGDI